MSWTSMRRRQIRYHMYRIKNEAMGGVAAEAPEGLKEYYEGQPGFEGWKSFAVGWDVGEGDPLKVRPRQFSVEEEWNATLRRVVPVLPQFEGMENRITDGSEG